MKTAKLLVAVLGIFLLQSGYAQTRVGSTIVENGGFESGAQRWQVKEPAHWQKMAPGNKTGVVRMDGEYQEQCCRSVVASQCIAFDKVSQFILAARFRYDSLPVENKGHRLNYIWYQDNRCSTGGQFGWFLEPRLKTGWQPLQKHSIKPALNARSVRLELELNQSSAGAVIQPGWFARLWAKIKSLFGFRNQLSGPVLAAAYWDDISFIPTQSDQSDPIDQNKLIALTLATGETYGKNGSFDNGLDHWRTHRSEWSADVGGTNLGALRATLVSEKNGMGVGVASQCLNIGNNDTFEASVKFMRDTQSTQKGGGRFRISWYELENCKGRSQAGKDADPAPDNTDWQSLEITDMVRPPNARSAKVNLIQTIDGKGEFSVYWDDMRFAGMAE